MDKRQSILYVGPLAFRPGVWETRATYIFPDLFEALPDYLDIHLLTGQVPAFAKKSLKKMCRRFRITHHEVRPREKKDTLFEYWEKEVLFTAHQINPDIITNIFGAVTLGVPMGIAGKKNNARVILRVAGDEIGTRLFMGLYRKNLRRLDEELAYQTLGIQLADKVIVMSPLEKERICIDLPEAEWNKVVVCIRGIDMRQFKRVPQRQKKDSITRFLYVGRKSVEKGYDILENVADITFTQNKNIEFVFAGSFDPLKNRNRNYIGWVDANKLHKTFSESDVFIMTSRTEGFPQVIAEAMATGLPCILPEHIFKNIFQGDKEAILTSLDPHEISEAVQRLHKDKALARTLANNGRLFAEKKLDRKVWMKVYGDIVAGKAAVFDPFSENEISETTAENHDQISLKEEQLKIALFVTPAAAVNKDSRHKLGRFIIEMEKRNHWPCHVFFPEENIAGFHAPETTVFEVYESSTKVRNMVLDLNPDLLIVAAHRDENLKGYSLVKGVKIPLVLMEVYAEADDGGRDSKLSAGETALKVWESEISYSPFNLIFTAQKNISRYLPHFLKIKTVPYPDIRIGNSDPCSDDGNADRLDASIPENDLKFMSWINLNKKIFDTVKTLVHKAADSEKIPVRLILDQMRSEPERVLHAGRIRQKEYMKYK